METKKHHVHLLTDEQQAIIESSSRVKVIEAYAGCGKSWTLLQEALSHPDERILYLVYGRRAKLEAERLFSECSHVDIRTLHGHAYRQERCRWKMSEYALSVFSMYKRIKNDVPDQSSHEVAWIIHAFINRYLNIPERNLLTAYKDFIELLSDEKHILSKQFEECILSTSEKILSLWLSQEEDCPHDFYLKASFLSGSFQKGLDKYNRILLDEAQDLSPIMFACLDGYKGSLAIVGDSHQSIYGFRYALNALAHVDPDEEFTLSKSFRFGKGIADFVTSYMQTLVDSSFVIYGDDSVDSSVVLSKRERRQDEYIVLARTNLELVTKSVDYLRLGKSFFFEKDVLYIFNKLEDLWHVFKQRTHSVKDEFLKTFKDMRELKRYATSVEDTMLLSLISVIETYKMEFPDLIYDLKESASKAYSSREGIALSTVHSAKGQEYPHVRLSSDLYKNIERAFSRSDDSLEEEFRVFYVAATRARYKLTLPREFEEIYQKGWLAWKESRSQKLLQRFWD